MDAAGLHSGLLALAASAAPWLTRETATVAAAAAILLVLSGGLYYRRRRRRLSTKAQRKCDCARELKQRLRRRLALPADPFAQATPGPTVGVSQVVEADLDAAAGGVLPEAGWRRGAAKQHLRKRLNGPAAAALNGSEAGYWRQLGVLALLDDADDALRAYARAADLAPQDAGLQLLLGVLNLHTGRIDAAEAMLRRQIDGQADNGASDGVLKYRAAVMLGDVLLAKGTREEALAAYETARTEVLALAEKQPEDPRWQRDASLMHDRIGDVLLADGEIDLALTAFRRSLETAEALAKADPECAALQHDLSVAHDRIGEALDLKGDLDGALESYRRGLDLAETVTRQEPERPDWRWDVSASLDRVGDVLAAKGKIADALAAYRRGLGIAQELATADPGRLDWQRDLAVSCHKIGLLEAQRGCEAEAREALEQGRAIIARFNEIARHPAQWRADLSKFDAALKGLGP